MMPTTARWCSAKRKTPTTTAYFPDPACCGRRDEAWQSSPRARSRTAWPGSGVTWRLHAGSEGSLGPGRGADVCFFYEACVEELVQRNIERSRAGKLAANILLQSGLAAPTSSQRRSTAWHHAPRPSRHRQAERRRQAGTRAWMSCLVSSAIRNPHPHPKSPMRR